MNNDILKFVLGQNNGGSETIIDILIIVIFIVGGIIKSLFSAKQQNQKQNQKKPAPHSSILRKPPASAEQIRMQRERVEQFLEGILQPKNRPLQPPKPVPAKPQAAQPVPVPAVTKVYKNESSDSELYKEMSAPVRKAETDTILDKNAIKIDNQLEQIQQLRDEHIQEDQRNLILHDKTSDGKKSDSALPSFSDSDDLRKAILYTEILGKPLSMREAEILYD